MKKRILLIEDEAAVADYLRDFLAREGFEVAQATTLLDAKKHLSSNFDLIMLDLTLPDGTGDQIIAQIKTVAPSVPVLMVTGAAADDERLTKCLQAGAVGYVNKAARVDEIARHLRRALGD
jgi:DNA-binding response OmpR family regulator